MMLSASEKKSYMIKYLRLGILGAALQNNLVSSSLDSLVFLPIGLWDDTPFNFGAPLQGHRAIRLESNSNAIHRDLGLGLRSNGYDRTIGTFEPFLVSKREPSRCSVPLLRIMIMIVFAAWVEFLSKRRLGGRERRPSRVRGAHDSQCTPSEIQGLLFAGLKARSGSDTRQTQRKKRSQDSRYSKERVLGFTYTSVPNSDSTSAFSTVFVLQTTFPPPRLGAVSSYGDLPSLKTV
ncbi:hypothetical protein P175DRAFT_0557770 [Aspergillus ochraceoroseus IBT 24754]|uniref:Uncharacterized protein n=1 Tax=Aspergillus ochraceoroseus IBT 24754 TaxID=1392256 RepID=A0A2T5LXT7_9EURO|nr:uncharacterized protein P175DRAFT_0557770 [Aspergillus ochraceoroseus IBT 24754]PTU21094.1 hypothetical protein P175DRAFT_0557770 [Aspergillus ochraceoroseus IBT 24754]